jgi:hypothetical protein
MGTQFQYSQISASTLWRPGAAQTVGCFEILIHTSRYAHRILVVTYALLGAAFLYSGLPDVLPSN